MNYPVNPFCTNTNNVTPCPCVGCCEEESKEGIYVFCDCEVCRKSRLGTNTMGCAIERARGE